MSAITDPCDVAAVDMRHPALGHNPHPLLRELRENHCVAREALGIWRVPPGRVFMHGLGEQSPRAR